MAFKKAPENPTLNGCISNARANSEAILTFSDSSLGVLQIRVSFRRLYPRGYTAGGSHPTNPDAAVNLSPGSKS